MKFLKENWQLLAILLLAAILRFYKLDTIPIGFNDDEAAFGYNAYSILQTGRDEWGRLLPFPAFESFGDWKLVFYLYLTVASQFIFGASVFATRFPSAVFGVLAVWATYLLTKKLFPEKIGLLAAFFLAISPWHVIASRNAFESDLQIFLITMSIFFFIKSLKNPKFIFLAIVLLSICLYTYRSSWLFVPLFVLTLVFLFRYELNIVKTTFAKILILTVVLVLPLVPTVASSSGQSRLRQESFISGVQKSGIVDDVNTRRGSCENYWPAIICVAAYNQYVFYFSTYLNNYISNLSPETYFIRGNPGGYQSFSIRSLFYTFELPLLILGVMLLVIKKHPAAKILIPWLLIVPIAPAITGVGNPGRLNILMPSVQIIAAFGLYSIFIYVKNARLKKILIAASFVIIISSTVRLIADLFVFYPQVSGSFQRYGYRQLFNYLESQKENYRQIAVSRQGDDAKQYIHYLFYTKQDPRIFFDTQITTKYRGADGWQQIERIGNFYFYEQSPKLEDLPPETLLATSTGQVLFPKEPIYVVKYLNGDRAFEVYDVDQVKELQEKHD